MRFARLSSLLLLIPVLVAWPNPPSGSSGVPAAASGCTASSNANPEAFTTDPGINTTWDEAMGDHADCPWAADSGDNNLLNIVVAVPGSCPFGTHSIHLDESMGSISQWGCATYVSTSDAGGDMLSPGIVARADSSTSSTQDFYFSWQSLGSSTVNWQGLVDTIGSCTASETLTAGDKICARWEGTGIDTTFEYWMNPTGDTPDDWGASDCCMNDDGATLRGTACTDVADGTPTTGLDDSSEIDDSGNYMGVRLFISASPDNLDDLEFDDIWLGTCP